ncbi:growth hormone secretagogue receptor type 1-like [Mercenaria mercenaria]|uniref:growth hormone secretagogue receptor type 1-like n=1 Tax=Mercenaria mercenaria TaxID=6596 RepID=UPI00234F142F|nr:growth hormone secretagogue receptor type 1-like [Mercenaria mercenaria]
MTSYSQQPLSSWFDAIKIMRNIFIPVIVCVGLFGNTLSLMVFSTESMRKSSSSVFLASLAFVDNTFLICLLITWIDGEVHSILVCDLACQLLIYTTYVTSCLSVWFIVCFTFERFIAICFPLKSTYICSVCRERGTVFILTIIACVMYNFSFWTTGMEQWGPLLRCSHDPKYIQFLNIVTWIDTSLTMVIPFFLIVCMNTMVLRSVMKCKPKNKNIVTSIRKRPKIRVNTRVQRRNPQIRVTRTLLFVSTTFLVLNLPSHTMRLYNLIYLITSDTSTITVQFSFLQELTLMFYYITFSCNFFLYTCFGRNFRHALYHMIYCQSVKETHRRKVLLRLSSSQGRTTSHIE